MSTYKDLTEAVMYDKNGLPIYGMDLELVSYHIDNVIYHDHTNIQ